jgi:acyl-CoA thioester hydrolase
VTGDERLARRASDPAFVAPVHVRWSDIDMYQHINHATMVTILEEARIPFLREPFGPEIETIGLLIHEVNILYKGQLRLIDSPLQVTMWSKRVRAVDFTVGYELRSVGASADSKPSVIAETQLAAVHIREQRLQRLLPAQREYLQRYLR